MFWHNYKYSLINTLKQREFLFWFFAFPIILGTCFYFAFGNLYEKEEIFTSIPVAIVENTENPAFKAVISEISSGEEPLFDSEYTDEETALDMLQEKEVSGIIYVNQDISLLVSQKGIAQTIIKSFLDQYKIRSAIIEETAAQNPRKLNDVIESLSREINCNENLSLSDGNMDCYLQYFHNLLAMVSLFGAMSGLFIAIENQGNLSAIAARRCIAPVNKFLLIITQILSCVTTQIISIIASTTHLIFILDVDFGNKIPMVYITGALGCVLGTTMGFFIGSIGRMPEGIKMSIATSFTMLLCFLSGLMVGNMKSVVEKYCPIINRINPAAIISDMFYYLNVYNDYRRYLHRLSDLLIISAVFIAGGFLLTRRKKYASI